MKRVIRCWFLIICINAFKFMVSHYNKSINGENYNVNLEEVRMYDLYTYHDTVTLKTTVDSKIGDFAIFEDKNLKEESSLYKNKSLNINWKPKTERIWKEIANAVGRTTELLTAKLIFFKENQICKFVQYEFVPSIGERVLRMGFKCTGAANVGVFEVLGAINKFLEEHSNTCTTWCLKLIDGNAIAYIKNGIDNNAWEGFGCHIYQRFGGCLVGSKDREYKLLNKRNI